MNRSASLLAVALLSLLPMAAHADSNTVLQGRVYQQNGVPAANVPIFAISVSGVYRTSTGTDGRFVMFGLENDVYQVEAISETLGRGTAYGTVVAPGETEYVVIPLSLRNCPAWGYSVRSSSSYLLEGQQHNSTTFKCV